MLWSPAKRLLTPAPACLVRVRARVGVSVRAMVGARVRVRAMVGARVSTRVNIRARVRAGGAGVPRGGREVTAPRRAARARQLAPWLGSGGGGGLGLGVGFWLALPNS